MVTAHSAIALLGPSDCGAPPTKSDSAPVTPERTTSTLFEAAKTTFLDAGIGLVTGTVAGLVVAMIFVLRRSVEATFMPVAMALRSVPLVAMTPLIALIFGRGLLAVAVISGIVTFFPALVNVTQALKSVPTHTIDLVTAYGGSPRTALTKVQFPASLPALFESAGFVVAQYPYYDAAKAHHRPEGFTNVAGPTGGTPEKPVGLVHIASGHRGGKTLHRECRFGSIGRGEIRKLSSMAALALAKELLLQI